MKTAYIVKAYRTAVGKAPKGVFRFKRPDELAAETIQHMMNELPDFDKKRIDDVMVGNAMPEAAPAAGPSEAQVEAIRRRIEERRARLRQQQQQPNSAQD